MKTEEELQDIVTETLEKKYGKSRFNSIIYNRYIYFYCRQESEKTFTYVDWEKPNYSVILRKKTIALIETLLPIYITFLNEHDLSNGKKLPDGEIFSEYIENYNLLKNRGEISKRILMNINKRKGKQDI